MKNSQFIKAFLDAFSTLKNQVSLLQGNDIAIAIFPNVSILHFPTGVRGAEFAKIVLTREEKIDHIKVIFRKQGTNYSFPFMKKEDQQLAVMCLRENKILPTIAKISVAGSHLVCSQNTIGAGFVSEQLS